MKKKFTTDAIDILHDRYIGTDAERRASLKEERVNAEVARTIYELREERGLTQEALAELVGTTQSVISRLEDADYEGHSLNMLNRIARALNKSLVIGMKEKDLELETRRFVFRAVVQGLRRERGLKVDEFAQKTGIDRDEVIAIERNTDYKPTPLTLYKLSKFFEIPQENLAILAGAILDIPQVFRREASNFAAKSESFSKLTNEEKQILDGFVKVLRTEKKGK
jgi:transcriptional regulator with XRE-family HTH domain